MSKRERITDPDEMIQYLRDYAAVKQEPTIADAAEMLENHEYRMLGVMHSVDKWLDGEELEQDEANRAATMREKTLRIAETLQAESAEKDKRIAELEAEKMDLHKIISHARTAPSANITLAQYEKEVSINEYMCELEDEVDRLKDVNKALENDQYNAEMNLAHITEENARLQAERDAAVAVSIELRDDFQSYVTDGIIKPSMYCANKGKGCADRQGWCITGKCVGFLPSAWRGIREGENSRSEEVD